MILNLNIQAACLMTCPQKLPEQLFFQNIFTHSRIMLFQSGTEIAVIGAV